MDKYEYKVRAEEIKALIAEGEFAEAVKIADTIDWRRVKSVMMLCTISDLYKINRRFQESKDILLMAYERHPGGRLIVYSLCELSIKMGEFVQAIEYYKEFAQIAPKDTGRYILQYRLYEAQDVSLEERIAVLEEFKKRDYREKWAYELAYLYHRVGLETKCVEECDEMFLWFGDGRYVMKALELKMLHQPLTAPQQEKYDWMKREKERQLAGLEEEGVEEVVLEEGSSEENIFEGEMEEENPEENAEPEEGYGEIADFSGGIQQEEEFKVKTIDMGQYNTINLQKELAESMKEILGEESDQDTLSMEPFKESVVAPLLQETGDMVSDAVVQEEKKAAPESRGKLPEPEKEETAGQEAREEVFFEEDVKDILLEDTKEISIGQPEEEKLGDTKEITPRRKPASKVRIQAAPKKEALVQPAPPVQSASLIQAGPHLMPTVKPSGFEQMLSQEYDGQISLVVPNKSNIEKQITGQLNITDIMAEWERMKRENEEKRKEDVRKRVQQHTGNMFSEFDEATKTGLLEQLEKAVIEAILRESGEKEISPEDITEEKLTDLVKTVGKKKSENKGKAEEEIKEEITEEQDAETPEETETGKQETAESDSEEPKEESVPAADEVSGETDGKESVAAETGIIDLEKLLLETAGVETGKETKAEAAEGGKLRALSDEEKELFGRFAHNRKTKEQIIHALDTMNMDSYNGNVIVTGEDGAGTLDLAKGLVRMMQMTDRNFSGKVAKISGKTFNKKDVEGTLAKLADGALIIEHAFQMSSETAGDLNGALEKEGRGLFVVMEGGKDEMNIFLRKNAALMDNFDARIDVESLDDHSLVEYAKQYAEEQEYSIDELGILALHTRIADMQTSDHEVTVAEVKDLVDDAIYFADKKNPKHFFDILFGKRYDEEDMVILREKDFMHY